MNCSRSFHPLLLVCGSPLITGYQPVSSIIVRVMLCRTNAQQLFSPWKGSQHNAVGRTSSSAAHQNAHRELLLTAELDWLGGDSVALP